MSRSKFISPILLILLSSMTGSAQLHINEACGKNNSVIADAFGSYTDWVEVHNSGSTAIALGDFYLSDDPTDPLKWQLPSVMLSAGGFYLLFAEDGIPSPDHFDFRLQQAGETITLSDQSSAVVSSMDMPYLRPDHSFGSYVEGGSGSFYFDIPTPGGSNASAGYLGYAMPPQFSPPPRVRSNNVQVSLLVPQNVSVHFTIDGHVADANAPLYSGPFTTTGPTAVSAIALQDSMLSSPVVYGSYIHEPDMDLPIISLSCHADSLFDDTLGLYMTGLNADTVWPYFGANYWSKREIPVNVEFFEDGGTRKFQQLAGLRIHGGRSSRNEPQRPFRLTARDRYGKDRFEHVMFPDRQNISRFKRLVLRNSGSDFCLSNIRDGYWHKLALEQGLDVDVLAFRPSEVYINGRHWGMMHIRERIDAIHLQEVFGVNADSVLLMEEDLSIQGDSLHFDTLLQHIVNKDLAINTEFMFVEERMDMASFKDYFILEIFSGNADWPANNLKLWKPSITGGKWRYLLYDLDATMMLLGWIPIDIDVHDRIVNIYPNAVHSKVYTNLLENDEFKRTYINRFADLLNTAFRPDTLTDLFQNIVNNLGSERPEHWARWCGGDEGNWNHHTQGLLGEFFKTRQDILRNQLQTTFSLVDQVELDFNVFPHNGGTVRINTIVPSMPFKGVYFNGNAIDVAAEASDGFVFDRWEYDDGTVLTAPSWQQDITNDQKLTAYFKRDEQQFNAHPTQFTDQVTVALETFSTEVIDITIGDMAGRVVYDQRYFAVNGMNEIQLHLAHLRQGMYLLSLSGDRTNGTTKLMRE